MDMKKHRAMSSNPKVQKYGSRGAMEVVIAVASKIAAINAAAAPLLPLTFETHREPFRLNDMALWLDLAFRL